MLNQISASGRCLKTPVGTCSLDFSSFGQVIMFQLILIKFGGGLPVPPGPPHHLDIGSWRKKNLNWFGGTPSLYNLEHLIPSVWEAYVKPNVIKCVFLHVPSLTNVKTDHIQLTGSWKIKSSLFDSDLIAPDSFSTSDIFKLSRPDPRSIKSSDRFSRSLWRGFPD